jgi:hypothetical protein
MRPRNAAVRAQSVASGSGPQKVLKAAARSVRKAVRPVLTAVTEAATPTAGNSQFPASRRYLVVEHLGDMKQVGRVIGEYSTLVLAQALLRSELEWGNTSVAIVDQALGEAILDVTSRPARVSLRVARARRV